jgi:hypothetical protein
MLLQKSDAAAQVNPCKQSIRRRARIEAPSASVVQPVPWRHHPAKQVAAWGCKVAKTQQRVCGAQCREARRRKLARRRRRRAPGRFRSEERVRQQERRARPSEGGCHAPRSSAKPWDPLMEIHEIVDSALELSRATLQRRLPVILARSGLSKRTKPGSAESMSRATLDP